jgi:hypothetical protein
MILTLKPLENSSEYREYPFYKEGQTKTTVALKMPKHGQK